MAAQEYATLTAADVARLLNCSRATAVKIFSSGKLRVWKIGERHKTTYSELNKYQDINEITPCQSISKKTERIEQATKTKRGVSLELDKLLTARKKPMNGSQRAQQMHTKCSLDKTEAINSVKH